MIRRITRLATVAIVGAAALMGPTATAAPAPVVKHCRLPAAGRPFTTATPAQERLDGARVTAAVDQLSVRMRLSVQVFRNDCLVAADPLDALTGTAHNNLWSVTKSVTSMLTGIAIGQGRLTLDAPIGRYLPTGPGWGDRAHRAITVRQLLTQTSGIDESILAEAATTGLDPSLPQEALAQPIKHAPGTHFEYSQLGPALLAYVVQRAVGENLATYAQRELFGPIGITRGSYLWLEDRSGTPYGYSNLFLTPTQLARLGLLMQDGGRWNGRQVVPAAYVDEVGRATATNGCYGLLFWTNAGTSCTGANIPAAQTVHRRMIPTAPSDAYEMNGTGGQLNVMIPSLHMTVTTTGYFGDRSPDPSILLGATPGDMQYTFFRTLMSAVEDVDVPDPGPYPGDPIDLDADPMNYLSPFVLRRDLLASPTCNVVVCNGTVPTKGLLDAVRALPGLA
ncbi:serine hydrolase domain-containing protein [Nocardioides terrisoli]|uniref:serine hydrolase domain-containing protein n=1 Tax=Nocardioides terrisoli TaxID=3388267 RepID=UPI00287B76BA|nr:serine hydrolase [Nocardioides marmorisolisilvae]